jgi:hypothetical protein
MFFAVVTYGIKYNDSISKKQVASSHIARRIWILGASWQSRLDDRSQIHSNSYGSRGIVQDATPDCS